MRSRRRVVITGLGVVAPNGIGKDVFWQNLVAGKSATRRITAFDPSPYPCQVAAEVCDFDPTAFMTPRKAKATGRFTQLALAAARLALADSALALTPTISSRTSVCFGNSVHGAGDVYEAAHLAFLRGGVSAVPQWTSEEYTAHAPARHVSMDSGITGQAITLASACSTGIDVVNWGYDHIRAGHADLVLAGASEAPIFPGAFSAICSLGVLTTWNGLPAQASRPYDARRDGFVLGEGGACVVLEDRDHALRRDASIYAEVLGYGNASDASHIRKAATHGHALSLAISNALQSSSLSARDIDYINAHGNALPDYDLAETNAFKHAFGAAAYRIPISSIKSMLGQALGVSGLFQVAASCLTLLHALIPPTINYQFFDPLCDLDYVPNCSRHARLNHILINAQAMGRAHSVLVLATPHR